MNGTYSGGKSTGSPYYVQPTSYTDKPSLANGSTSLTAAGGFQTNYSGSPTKPGSGWTVRAYNADTGDAVPGIFPAGETIASCTSNASCTLTLAAKADVSSGRYGSTPIEVETGPPGGCGLYDLADSSAGTSTGSPRYPYFDNCNWWVQDLTVSGNVFVMSANPTKNWTAGSVTNCTAADGCGYMWWVLYANSAVNAWPSCLWSPYANYVDADLHNLWSGSQCLAE